MDSKSENHNKKKKRNRIIRILLNVLGCCVIVVQILILTDVIPVLPKTDTESQQDQQAWIVGNNNGRVEAGQPDEASREYSRYVFVGDSRYVGMSALKENGDVFLAKNGVGYEFLIEQLTNIRAVCNDETALIVGLGVNDLNYSCEKYIAKLNELADELDCQIYYMSVNPVDEKKEASSGYSVKNDKIDQFNEKMQAGLSDKIRYIDTNAYLNRMTYNTVDGLHYNEGTYQLIYHYIKASL